MIRHSKQQWEPGKRVKVGFLTLLIVEVRQHDYLLVDDNGVGYVFQPHHGLHRLA